MTRVMVTGVGVVSPIGFGKDAFWKALLGGQSGAGTVKGFDVSKLDRDQACEVKGFVPRDFLTAAESRRTGRCSQFALAAARMAVTDAGLTEAELTGPQTSVVLGTTMGEADVLASLEHTWIHEGDGAVHTHMLPRYGTTLLPIHVARAFGAQGMVQTLPSACAAGNYAIGYAADQIRAGRADIMITGAAEVIAKLQFQGFVRLGAMTPDHVRPFDENRKGILLGEGAGVLVLESEAHALKRGAEAVAEVGGYGLACDAHHITRPHPEGEGSARAMRQAISASGLTARDVDAINAHGTATPANDVVESKVIREIFGDHRVPVTSIKSMIGHCMGAASAIEAVSCVLSIRDGVIPPTINHDNRDPECDVDVVSGTPRQAKADVVINNSLAFGGYDAVVCFGKPGAFPKDAGMAA